MGIHISLEGLSSNEANLSDLVAAVRLSIEQSVVSVLRKLVGVTIDGLQVVVVPAFMDFRSYSQDSECVFVTLESGV